MATPKNLPFVDVQFVLGDFVGGVVGEVVRILVGVGVGADCLGVAQEEVLDFGF